MQGGINFIIIFLHLKMSELDALCTTPKNVRGQICKVAHGTYNPNYII